MKKIAVICARKNSERVPDKNIALLNGQPLINYTIKATQTSKIFDQIYVNSDDDRILKIAESLKVNSYNRPKHLGHGNVYVIDVIKNFLNTSKFDKDTIVSILFPTCPLRNSEDIINAFRIFKKNNYLRPVAAVTEYEYPVDVSLSINAQNLLEPTFGQIKSTRHNDNKVTYRANYSVMFNTSGTLMGQSNLIGQNPIPYIMPHERSVDIDNPYQMEVAKLFLEAKIQNL
jgi:CMP-N,N'-diacetyllegionaminic acid synthase